ncbi:hypothetical protein PR001_g19260 [Phytophthora rubi]|uniref:BRO1 domain-containing protein n=1 Tax=Phytophthora rubi TaxID=129364 RepID=A0A6A3JUZ3_9STRA|nr:hypothetical protein PR001_g19260 [Phytophthora rubi]
MTQREGLPPCCHALTPGLKRAAKTKFASELAKFGVSTKADGVQRLARAALQLEGDAPAPSAVFQSPDDISSYTQKLATYLSLVKGFTESRQSEADADAALQASVPVTDAPVGAALRQPLVEGKAEADGALGDAHGGAASARDCSGCLNFCRWQDAITGQTVYATSARQEYAHVLLAAGIFMMTDARDKVDAILSERLSELDETQLKLAYQLLLHAAGVLDACLESMNVAPCSIGADFADLGAKAEANADNQGSANDVGAVPDDDMMAKWREEQRQIQQVTLQKVAPDSTATPNGGSAESPASDAAEDLAMLKRIPDLADGRFPQLLAWIALAEAQELVVLRGVTREVVDFTLMAKLSVDISARYKECQTIASRLLPYSTSTTAERIRLYYAQNCVQAVANFTKTAALFEGVVSLEKSYESKMATDKEEKQRVALLAAVFLRSQQIISRDLDIVSHRNDSVYYEPIPAPEVARNALSLVKPATFPTVTTSDLWRDGEPGFSNNNRKPVALTEDAVQAA